MIIESVMAVIWGTKVEAVSVLASAKAKFDGIFGILTRIARAVFERFEEIPFAVFLLQ